VTTSANPEPTILRLVVNSFKIHSPAFAVSSTDCRIRIRIELCAKTHKGLGVLARIDIRLGIAVRSGFRSFVCGEAATNGTNNAREVKGGN